MNTVIIVLLCLFLLYNKDGYQTYPKKTEELSGQNKSVELVNKNDLPGSTGIVAYSDGVLKISAQLPDPFNPI